MALLSRKSAQNAAPAAQTTANAEELKIRARNRLIGMLVLLVSGIISFALILDAEPRNTEREITFEIPERGESVTVRVPARAREATDGKTPNGAPQAPLVSEVVRSTGPNADADGLDEGEMIVETPATRSARRQAALAKAAQDGAPLAPGTDETQPLAQAMQDTGNDKPQATRDNTAAKVAASQAELKAKAEKAKADKARADKAKADKAAAEKAAAEKKAQAAKAETDKDKDQLSQLAADKLAAQKQAEKADAEKKAQAKKAEADRALALLEGQHDAAKPATAPAPAAGNTRTVVQFGSFNDAAKAAEVRRKVQGAGLKTYEQVIDTPKGKMIRLRVGPFTSDKEAQAAAQKIKALGLPAAILTL